MTGCLADSPSPVPLHVCFHRGFDWTSLSLAAGRKRDPETAKDPPPWQPGCMFETTSFRSEMISVDCHPSNSVYEITSVCVCVRVCVREGYCLLYWHLMRARQIHFTHSNQHMDMNESATPLDLCIHALRPSQQPGTQPLRLSVCA